MIIVDADTMLYRVGFSNPPDEDCAKAQIAKYARSCIDRVSSCSGISFDEHLLVVTLDSPAGRYRTLKFGKTVDYKAHRTAAGKPLFVPVMQEQLCKTFRTFLVPSHEREADDACSAFAHEYRARGLPYVVAAVDKDLNQIPGNHYNYVKDTFYHVTEEEANKFFFEQLLTGDTADNIPGIYGIGPIKAKKILSKGSNSEEWWELTVKAYSEYYQSNLTTPAVTDDALTEMLYERGNMLWIQRYEGQEWYPPIPDIAPF